MLDRAHPREGHQLSLIGSGEQPMMLLPPDPEPQIAEVYRIGTLPKRLPDPGEES